MWMIACNSMPYHYSTCAIGLTCLSLFENALPDDRPLGKGLFLDPSRLAWAVDDIDSSSLFLFSTFPESWDCSGFPLPTAADSPDGKVRRFLGC